MSCSFILLSGQLIKHNAFTDWEKVSHHRTGLCNCVEVVCTLSSMDLILTVLTSKYTPFEGLLESELHL